MQSERGKLTNAWVLMFLAVPAGCSKQDPKAIAARPPPIVTAQKVVHRDVAVEVQAPVDLRPISQADVGSKTLGYLDAVLVDRGDLVKKGQLLALVRPSDLPDQLAAARGALAQSEASLNMARANGERAKSLAPSGVVSQQELQQATTGLEAAEAAAAAAKAQLGALAVRLGETRILSPLDGVVTQRRLDPGALVGPPGGGAILSVAQTNVLRVFIAVTERDAMRVTVGKDAHVEVDALPRKSFRGQVVRLAPAFDLTTRTLDAEVHLPNDSGLLRPGMYGRGSIVIDIHQAALVVPGITVLISNGRKYVFAVAGDKVERRAIETGVDEGDWVEVTKGLSGGEELVTAGADGLSDGAQVRVVRNVDPFSGAKIADEPGGGSDSSVASPN